MEPVQLQGRESGQRVKGFASGIESHILYIMYIGHIHVLQSSNQVVRGDMGVLVVQLCFQQAVYQQGRIADQKMCPDPLRQPVVDGPAGKICLHNPKAVFNLIPFVGHCQYVLCRVQQVGGDGIITIIPFLFFNLFLIKLILNLCLLP